MSEALSRGRKKGSRNLLSVFEDVAEQKIKVKIGGEVHKVTRIIYVLWANYYEGTRKKKQNSLNNMFILAEELGLMVDRDDFNNGARRTFTSGLSQNRT